MGVPKTSRKGKRAWRKNIDTQQVEAALEEATREERQGTAVHSLSDTQLFYVDKAPDDVTAAALATGRPQLLKKQKEKKLLRCQAIIAAAHTARPVVSTVARKRKVSASSRLAETARTAPRSQIVCTQQQSGSQTQEAARDVWSEAAPEPADKFGGVDVAADPSRPAPKRRRVRQPEVPIKPLEVDAPGCSYNPEHEQHQEAVAQAVASQVSAVLAAELRAQAPPLRVDWQPEQDELAALLVDVEPDDGALAPGEGALAPGSIITDSEPAQATAAVRALQRKTKKDRARQARRRAAEEEAAAKQRLRAQRQALDALPSLAEQLAAAEAEQEARRLRKKAVREERAVAEPPRLGKHRFQPAPLAVLLSEEVGAGLRKLKPVPFLARERYKALQKRGVIEPRVRVSARKARRVVLAGDRLERVRAAQDELEALQAAAKQRRRSSKR